MYNKEPMRTQSKYTSPASSAGKREWPSRDLFLFCIWLVEMVARSFEANHSAYWSKTNTIPDYFRRSIKDRSIIKVFPRDITYPVMVNICKLTFCSSGGAPHCTRSLARSWSLFLTAMCNNVSPFSYQIRIFSLADNLVKRNRSSTITTCKAWWNSLIWMLKHTQTRHWTLFALLEQDFSGA